MVIDGKKRCPKCNTVKDVALFSRCSSKSDGYQALCKVCRENHRKLDRLNNPEKYQAYGKEYYIKNRERILAAEKEAYFTKKKDYLYKYYLEHIEEKRAYYRKYQKIYRQTLNGKRLGALGREKRRCAEEHSPRNFSKEDLNFILSLQDFTCCACGASFSKTKYTVDHIIPVSKGGILTLSNTQLLCRSCNSSKGAKTIDYLSYYIAFGKYYLKEKGDLYGWAY